MEELTLARFEEASEKVKEVILDTKLVYSDYFSNQTGNKVYLKPENMQFTGAYKVRGAYYKMSTLSDDERKKGIITASASCQNSAFPFFTSPRDNVFLIVERIRSYAISINVKPG